MRTIDWDESARTVVLIDQTVLPGEERWLTIREIDELCEAIGSLRVRGAMALGAAGALGVALAAARAADNGQPVTSAVADAAERLIATRPTAVNLAVGVRGAAARVADGADAVLDEALQMLAEDEVANERMCRRAADLVCELAGRSRQVRLLTHCNTGRLAAVDWGSALGTVRALHEQDLVRVVYVSETRPLLQGARLTAWELGQLGVVHKVIVDSAAAGLIVGGGVDAVLVGADRIAANGDTANKIGTLTHALAAKRAGVPFLVVAPESTIDHETATGDAIVIEERDEAEVLDWKGTRLTPASTTAWNPAFDVTPADLITAIVTEERLWRPE